MLQTCQNKTSSGYLFVLPASNTRYKVHLGSANQLGLVPKLIPKVQDEEYRDRQIIGNKRCGVPSTLEEDAPLREEDDDDCPPKAPISSERH